MSQYKLTYFDLDGRAEASRLLLTIAGKDFEDIRVTDEDTPKWKPGSPFGQIPILQVDDTTLCQSHVMERYLAQEFGLAGKNNIEQARAAMIVECIEESTLGPLTRVFLEQDPAKKEQLKKDYVEKLPTFLNYLENFAKQNNGGNGFFVGDQLTYTDLVLFTQTTAADREGNLGLHWDNYPALKKIRENVSNQPGVKAWEAKRAAAAKKNMPQYKLTYYDSPGRAEACRLLFSIAGKDFEDNRVSNETADQWKPTAPFGQLPMLQVDGKTLCQSHVMERYLAQEFGLAGKGNFEQAKAAMIVECVEDSTYGPFSKFFFEKDEAKKQQIKKEYLEEKLPKFLTYLENFAKETSGAFFMGDQISYPDVVFFTQMGAVDKEANLGGAWDKWPALKKLRDSVANHPGVKAWEAKRATAAKK